MVKSSRENNPPQIITLAFDQKTRGLQAAIAFGTSMRPFLKPGAEIISEPIAAADLHLGDVITFKSNSGALVTHRIVKKNKCDGKFSFLTKGDSRMNCDPVIFDGQIIGKVVRVNGVDISSFKWRFTGRCVAFFSYSQYVFYQGLAKSSVNQLRKKWTDKFGWPEFSAAPWFSKLVNPVRWCDFFLSWIDWFLKKRKLRELLIKGVQIRSGEQPEENLMTEIWNEAFPMCRTTVDRLSRLFCCSQEFRPEGYFTVKQSEDLLGWAYVRENPIKKGTGVIDVIALTEKAQQAEVENVLFQEILEWFKKRRFKNFFLGVHPTPSSIVGIQQTSLMKTAAIYGFEPTEVTVELKCSREDYSRPENANAPEEFSIQPGESASLEAIHDFLIRNNASNMRRYYDDEGNTGDVLVAKFGETVVGFCRYISWDSIKDFNQVELVRALWDSGRRPGYFLRLFVDKNFRSKNIGTALTAQAFERLFAAGCQEVCLVTGARPVFQRFYGRFGCKTAAYYFEAKRIEKN